MAGGKNGIKGIHSGHMYQDNLGGSQYYQPEVDEGGGTYSISGEKAGRTLISKEAARQKAIDNGWVDPNISQEDYNKKIDAWYKSKGTTPQEISKSSKDRQVFKKGINDGSSKIINNTGGGQNQSQSITNNVNTGGKSTTTTTPPPANPPANSSSTSSTGYTGNNPNAGQWQKQNVTNNINISGLGGGGGSTGGGGNGPTNPGGGIAKNMDSMLGRQTKPNTFKKTTGLTNNQPGGKTPYKFRGLENQFQSWQMQHYNNDTTT